LNSIQQLLFCLLLCPPQLPLPPFQLYDTAVAPTKNIVPLNNLKTFPVKVYINTNIMFLDVIHRLVVSKNRPVYFSKHNVLETEFCLRLQVKPTQLSPIDRASPYLRTGDRAQLSRF
jgi:hypothetical protein